MKLFDYLTVEEQTEYQNLKEGKTDTNAEIVLATAMIRLLDADFGMASCSYVTTDDMVLWQEEARERNQNG